ncbi:MAG: CoA transferase [Chloroflexi bacterium]|nr:CoA transferase [Chloroflexota bacterium]
MHDQALTGMLVLDLSQGISGAFCTKLLADFGAEVIKVEPLSGEPTRRLGPCLEDHPGPERSGTFLFLNTNKKSLTLDIACQTGASIFKKLVKQADIVVESSSPGVMTSLGLGYEDLEAIKPDIIVTSISYFGQTGPYRDYKGSDMIALALGGLMHVTGLPEREPLKTGGSQAEMQAGLNAAVATLTALYCRDVSGIGQHVDIAVVECITSIMEATTMMHNYTGQIRTRNGARHHVAYPSTILPCKDGYVHVHGAVHEWERLAAFVDEPRLLDEELQKAPRVHADEIDALILPWLMQHNKQEIFAMAQLWRLPFAIVCRVDELLDDPQFSSRDFFAEIHHPVTGPIFYPGAPFKMSETPWQAGRAPLLGEHTTETLGGRLGYAEDDLVRLGELGVV